MASPDALLLDRWMEGRDPEAFRALVERYSAMVYATARRIVPSPDQADDVTQQCFLKLAQASGARTSLPGWLHRVATNLALSLVRTETRRKEKGPQMKYYSTHFPEIDALISGFIDALPEQLQETIKRGIEVYERRDAPCWPPSLAH